MTKVINIFKKYYIEIFSIILFISLRTPSFFESAWHTDEGVYIAIGKNLLQGEILYRDIWDHKPPLIYFIFMILNFFSDTNSIILASRILGFVLSMSIVIQIYIIAKRFIGYISQTFKAFICILLAIFFGGVVLEANVTNAELFFLPINLIFIHFLLRIVSEPIIKIKRYKEILLGLLLGLLLFFSFTIKITGFVESIFLFGWICVFLYKLNHKLLLVKILLFSTISFMIPFLGLLLYFYTQNALIDFYQAVIGANIGYVSDGAKGVILFGYEFSHTIIKTILFIISVVITLAMVKRGFIGKTVGVFLMILYIELFCVTLSGRVYGHYFQQLVPSAIFLLLSGLNKFGNPSKTKALAIISIFITLFSSSILYVFEDRLKEAEHFKVYYLGFISNYILNKDEPSFVYWDNNPKLVRAMRLSDHINAKFPSNASYFLYSDEPWLEICFPFKSTNIVTVSFQQDMTSELRKIGNQRLADSDYVVIDILLYRELDFKKDTKGFELVETYEGYEIWKKL